MRAIMAVDCKLW